jgi:N-acetyl-anhydromuramyl-L-alanine amidase AmpD
MLDLDGTLYQTLDLKERAWHATTSNSRSIGIEIANIGAFDSADEKAPFHTWYKADAEGYMRIQIPAELGGEGCQRTTNFVGRPSRPQPVSGKVQGRDLVQFDLTPEQYRSLVKLTAALCRIFPKIKCDYPRDEEGHLIPHKLSDLELEKYQGLLGHYHIQENKIDPGPAFQWDYVVEGVRGILKEGEASGNARGNARMRGVFK